MKKIVLVLILVLVPVLVFAGELKLVKGKGIPVCEAHFKNLKTLKLDEMVCQRDESYPQENGITRPKWEQIDLEKNKELIKKIHKFLSYGDQFATMEIMDDEKQFGSLFDTIYSKSHALYKAIVNIDNDGKAETVLLYIDGFCIETHVYSRPLLVLDEAKNQIDVERTAMLLDPLKKYTDIKTKVIVHYQLYDVFFYKNTSYFDKWDADSWTLTVYKQSKDKTKEVCKYKYIEKPIKK